jgi:citrate lyase beta subunit
VHKAFGGGNLREKAHLEDGKTLLKWISKKWDGDMDWINLLRIETRGGLLLLWEWTSAFHRMQGIFWLPEDLLASQGVCSMG